MSKEERSATSVVTPYTLAPAASTVSNSAAARSSIVPRSSPHTSTSPQATASTPAGETPVVDRTTVIDAPPPCPRWAPARQPGGIATSSLVLPRSSALTGVGVSIDWSHWSARQHSTATTARRSLAALPGRLFLKGLSPAVARRRHWPHLHLS